MRLSRHVILHPFLHPLALFQALHHPSPCSYAVNATVVVVSACVPPILLFCSYWAPWRWGW